MRELVTQRIIDTLADESFINMRYRTVPEILEKMIDSKFVPGKAFNRAKNSYVVTAEKLDKINDNQLLDLFHYVTYRFYTQM